jgi:hypothetical protein
MIGTVAISDENEQLFVLVQVELFKQIHTSSAVYHEDTAKIFITIDHSVVDGVQIGHTSYRNRGMLD